MKHTTTRKKMLLSSVAMLLVAMLALSSATFAWFTSNPNSYAKGLSLKTTASTGLVVLSESQDRVAAGSWSHYTTLNAINELEASGNYKYKSSAVAVDLTPVSQKQDAPSTFYTVSAAKSSEYGKSDDTPTTTTEGYYSEKIYCRLSDGSDATAAKDQKVYLKGITITSAENATMDGCIRVAVANGDSLLGTWALTSANNGVLTPDAGDYSPALAVAGTNLNVDTGLTALKADGSDRTKFITVYVYLDGQDTNCFSDKVGTVNAEKIISSVQLDLQLA